MCCTVCYCAVSGVCVTVSGVAAVHAGGVSVCSLCLPHAACMDHQFCELSLSSCISPWGSHYSIFSKSTLSVHAEHYADELEEVLDDTILHDFNVEAEDGSPRQVGAGHPQALWVGEGSGMHTAVL